MCEENKFYEGFDEKLQTHILDEDKLLDELETVLGDDRIESNVVDYHHCELFPERWFHLVIVLRSDNNELYSRYERRNYNVAKIEQNIQAEIFQTIYDEAINPKLCSNYLQITWKSLKITSKK